MLGTVAIITLQYHGTERKKTINPPADLVRSCPATVIYPSVLQSLLRLILLTK